MLLPGSPQDAANALNRAQDDSLLITTRLTLLNLPCEERGVTKVRSVQLERNCTFSRSPSLAIVACFVYEAERAFSTSSTNAQESIKATCFVFHPKSQLSYHRRSPTGSL